MSVSVTTGAPGLCVSLSTRRGRLVTDCHGNYLPAVGPWSAHEGGTHEVHTDRPGPETSGRHRRVQQPPAPTDTGRHRVVAASPVQPALPDPEAPVRRRHAADEAPSSHPDARRPSSRTPQRILAAAVLLLITATPVLARSTSALGLNDAVAAEIAAHPDQAGDTLTELHRGGVLAGAASPSPVPASAAPSSSPVDAVATESAGPAAPGTATPQDDRPAAGSDSAPVAGPLPGSSTPGGPTADSPAGTEPLEAVPAGSGPTPDPSGAGPTVGSTHPTKAEHSTPRAPQTSDAPSTDGPATETPVGQDAPDTTAPEITAPETTAPDTTAPVTSAPPTTTAPTTTAAPETTVGTSSSAAAGGTTTPGSATAAATAGTVSELIDRFGALLEP